LETVEADYGADQVWWFDEHFYGALSIPEVEQRRTWYGFTGWPYVRVDGNSYHQGIYDCEGAAASLSMRIDARLSETGGMSPVEITGVFRAGGSGLEYDCTFRLLDPVALTDLKATLAVIEDGVLDGDTGDLDPRVTRRILYQDVTLSVPGDVAVFAGTWPCEPGWNPANLRAVVFLQQWSGDKAIIQGVVLSNASSSVNPGAWAGHASGPRIDAVLPNPFSAATDVRMLLSPGSRGQTARLEVFDPLGRRVRVFLENWARPESRVVRWDGRGDDGARLPGGTYFLRLSDRAGSDARTVVLVP
jgi:hypothetical protein